MRTMQLLEGLEFDGKRAHAVPLFVDKAGRALCFALRPGQHLKQHAAPSSPLYLVVLKGEGMFAGGDGKERRLGPSSLAILDRGEARPANSARRWRRLWRAGPSTCVRTPFRTMAG